MADHIESLMASRPELRECQEAIRAAVACLEAVYRNGGKILICGNGGSAADAEHITAELMKGFLLDRPLPISLREKLCDCPHVLVERLQMGVPAISLVGSIGLATAFANDVCYEAFFAQQVLNLGKAGDCLLALSASGNSENVINAMRVAKSLDLALIGLTGARDCKMRSLADILIAAPAESTPRIQEYHLAIYHALCAELEARLFG